MNKFTQGKWSVKEYSNGDLEMYCTGYSDGCIMSNETYYPWNPNNEHDWYLFATAGTTATKLAEAGYDSAAYSKAFNLLKQCRGE